MPRIFLPAAGQSDLLKIEGEQAHYLAVVLRCKRGDEIVVFDGKSSYKAVITGITRKSVLAEVIGTLMVNTESDLNSVLVQGLLKGEKMDLIIQKTTELGIKKIMPVITERSIVRETRKTARWRKVVEEASKQCGRTVVPCIHEPVPLKALFSKTSHALPPYSKGIILWEEGGLPLKEAVLKIFPSPTSLFSDSPLYILIGPEGGFTKKEVALAKSRGLIVTSLGRRILRAETAAIVVTALAQYLFEDIAEMYNKLWKQEDFQQKN